MSESYEKPIIGLADNVTLIFAENSITAFGSVSIRTPGIDVAKVNLAILSPKLIAFLLDKMLSVPPSKPASNSKDKLGFNANSTFM